MRRKRNPTRVCVGLSFTIFPCEVTWVGHAILLDDRLIGSARFSQLPQTMTTLPRKAKSIKHVWYFPRGFARRISQQNFAAHARKRLIKLPHVCGGLKLFDASRIHDLKTGLLWRFVKTFYRRFSPVCPVVCTPILVPPRPPPDYLFKLYFVYFITVGIEVDSCFKKILNAQILSVTISVSRCLKSG